MSGDLEFALSTDPDRDFDSALWLQEAQQHLRWCLEESAKTRRELKCTLSVHFGEGPDETADIFPSAKPNSPIVVFFPGKDWQAYSSEEFSFVAAGLHAHDLTVVVLNQSYCPAVSITEITRQGRAALRFIHREASHFHGDASRIFIAGHAAGGQQVGMMLSTNWRAEHNLPADLVKGAIPICGTFDLRQLRDSALEKTLQLHGELAQKESPILHIPGAGPPLLISVGSEVSALRLRQSTDYLAAWQQKGLAARLLLLQGRNHLSALGELADPASPLCRAIVEFIAACEKSPPGELTPPGEKRAAEKLASVPKPPVGPPVEAVARGGALLASFAQQRMWLITEMFPDSYIYNEPIQIDMDGAVNASVLTACMTEIVRRHEAWRTTFHKVDGEPRQQIAPPSPFKLDVIELTAVPADQRESEALRAAVEHARRLFNLKQGPLVRALLIRLDGTRSRLVVTAHHIVADGVSFFNVFLPELSALYAAFSRGAPSPLPELTFQPADFAAWQRRWLTEAELAPKLAYWRKQLDGFTEVRPPADFTKPFDSLSHGAREAISLSQELSSKLRELGHRAGASLFTTLLAAWKTLLFRYVGHSDIVVGSAAAGRSRAEFDRLIGYFNNNLVLRTKFDGSLSFVELIGKVAETLREAREHQDVPFDRLVTELKVDRNPYRNPFFENTFILMPPLPALAATPDWRAGRFDLGVAKVELYLELHQRPAGLVGHIEYQTELFSAATIRRMIGHLQTLLEAIVRDPSQRLDELPLLTSDEERQLAEWQGRPLQPGQEAEVLSLEQLFEAQVARSPQAIAVEHGAERVTYAELDARANQLAHHLRAHGVGPDTLVGLYIERSIDAMVGILAVLKAGGAYVPLDPAYPRERLRFMIEDAELRILLASAKNLANLPEHQGQVILIDRDWPAIAKQSTARPTQLATTAHLAYVIYTSGSTGRPKGVLLERRGLYYLAKGLQQRLGLDATSRVLQFFSLSFDGSVWDLAMTWPVGATLVLADREALVPGSPLVELIEQKSISAVMVTPSTLAVMPPRPLSALKVLITGGEALAEDLVSRWGAGRRFFNAYGPTEITVAAAMAECRIGEGKPPIGQPLVPGPVYILDERRQRVPAGIPGELYIGGPGVSRGYLKRPELTADRFVASPIAETAGMRLYRSGDRAKWRSDGSIEFLGRVDHQVKLRGFRIELGEIETELGHHADVEAAAVTLFEFAGDKRLAAYVVPKKGAPEDLQSVLKTHLRARLPEYMVPATFVLLDRMPLNPIGKIDREALPVPLAAAQKPKPPSTSLEQMLSAIWQEVLDIEKVDIDALFFDVGGHSLALARVEAKILAQLSVNIDVLTLMRLPTIRQLAAHIATLPSWKAATIAHAQPVALKTPPAERAQTLAIVGMAIRAPGVRGPEELWDVVLSGRETVRTLSPLALIAAGASPERVRRPDFVPAEGVLEDATQFDAAFFGYSDADAAMMDPQQRLFLECACEALEHAGIDPSRFAGRIGVFAGAGTPRYWLGPVQESLRGVKSDQAAYRAQTLNAPDFLATRVAFKLGLRGPAVAVQTACSTSLSAVHLARQSLLAGECDVALAGGVSLSSLKDAERGYIRIDGGIESVDGHCRPFDSEASGLVKSSGVAIVVMRRLAEAIADRDTIHSLVLSSAMNNDGASKMGFTALSEDGVAAVVEQAIKTADIDPRSVGFVEAHGTGTRLGDPTEVRALTRAYRRFTEERGFCALGSVKANLGHLDAAAGAAGLIKATLALAQQTLPPLVNFRAPNPLLDLPSTPFFVDGSPRSWAQQKQPRRAGVSSLGIGGTNVHVILEEAAKKESSRSQRPAQLLCLSARTEQALTEAAQRLRDHLAKHPTLELADVAYTLAAGRTPRAHRLALLCQDIPGAIAALGDRNRRGKSIPNRAAKREVVFLFPGHGVQYLQMGRGLYEQEAVFRGEIDKCLQILLTYENVDLLPLLVQPKNGAASGASDEERLDQMSWAQPFLFTVEYSLARLLLFWGVQPTATLGHSLGEYVAACVAGVMSLQDALALVVARGRMMDSTPEGGMITAFADERAVAQHLDPGATISTYAPGCIVIAGLHDALAATRASLEKAGIETGNVRVSRASHSPVMRQIREAFRKRVAAVQLRAPNLPIISNLTGTYLTAEQAMSPDYWADHLCRPVRLRESFDTLLGLDAPLYVEVGPGNTLGTLLKAHPRHEALPHEPVSVMPSFRQRSESPHIALLSALGSLWESDLPIDWVAFYREEQRGRVPLPTYPFQQRQHLLEADSAETQMNWDARSRTIASELGARTVDDFPGLRLRLEELGATLVLDFFARRLGEELGLPRTAEALRNDAGILPKFLPMFEMLLQVLEHGKLLTRSSNGELLLRADQAGRSTALYTQLIGDFSAFSGLARFLKHCVDHYDQGLTGIEEPVGVLYPDGTDALYRECMANVPPSHNEVYCALAREVVLAAVTRRQSRKVRILEVGGGHGYLTWQLVEQLRGKDVEYHFTDIGRSFLHRATVEAEQRGIPFMKMRRFDLNRSASEQSITEHFDLIIGLNAVHVALDLPSALRNLRSMLVSDGALVIVESIHNEQWGQLIWGLAPGYWEVMAARGALAMDLPRWRDFLSKSGFVGVDTLPHDELRRKVEGSGLIIANRSPSSELGPRPAPEREPEPELRVVAKPHVTRRAPPPPPLQPPPPPVAVEPPAAKPINDPAQQLVRELWSRLTGVPRIPNDTSFFDLGGDSLLAVHFLAEVTSKTGCEIKMRQFLAQPTVEGVAALLRKSMPAARSAPPPNGSKSVAEQPEQSSVEPIAESSAVPSIEPIAEPPAQPLEFEARAEPIDFGDQEAVACLVPLRTTGSKRPFFCVHPIGGGTLCYTSLLRLLDAERPFFGIQSAMLEDPSAVPQSIIEMAASYLTAMRRAQPAGPYLLGGWSFGGVVAIEMARQLVAAGEEVAELVLFDVAIAPSRGLDFLHRIDRRMPALALLPSLFSMPGKEAALGASADGGITRLSDLLAKASRDLLICDHHLALWRNHRTTLLDVQATHFIANSQPIGIRLRAAADLELPIRGLRTLRVPGDHFSMLSDKHHVAGLSAQLGQVLDSADRRIHKDSGRADGRVQDEASVRLFLKRFVDAMQARDGAALGTMFAPDERTSLIGVGDSVLVGSEVIAKRYLRNLTAVLDLRAQVKQPHIFVLAGGRVACVTARLDSDQLRVGRKQKVTYRDTRLSMILEKRGDSWWIVQLHYSLPQASEHLDG